MLAPKLRFKEFNNEWKKERLNKISTINPKSDNLPNKFIYIDLESVQKGILLNKNIINKIHAPSRAQRTVKLNDILFQTVRPYQQNNYFVSEVCDIPYIASTGYALIRTNQDPYFIYTLIHRQDFLNKVMDMCTGTSFPAINSNDLGTIEIKIPLKKEQEKISKLFSLLNKKIELQKRKIEVLKMYKKGLSDNIYASLKEKIIELNNYAIVQGGFAFKSELFQKKGKPIVRISNIYNNLVDLNDLVYYDSALEIDKKFYVNDSDLLIAMSGATTGKYGIYHNTYPAYLNQRVGKIICKKDTILYYPYLYFLFGLTAYEKQLQSRLIAGAQPNISPADIENMKFKFPNINTQKKIADMIINITKKISIENKKLDNLNILKQSLLQQMFI